MCHFKFMRLSDQSAHLKQMRSIFRKDEELSVEQEKEWFDYAKKVENAVSVEQPQSNLQMMEVGYGINATRETAFFLSSCK